MAKLQVTISHELARMIQELFRDAVEAMDIPIDPKLDDDYAAFCDSIRAAKRRARIAELRKRLQKE